MTSKEKYCRECILVTGAAGLLGRAVVRLCGKLRPGARIIAADISGKPDGHESAEWYHGDLCDINIWNSFPEDISHVFHLSARIPWDPAERTKAWVVSGNITPIANLLQKSMEWKYLRHVAYSSSVAVYGKVKGLLSSESQPSPQDMYGAAKLSGEVMLSILRGKGVKAAMLRFSSLYGPGQYQGTVLPMMIKRAEQGLDIEVYGKGDRTQDFIAVEDAATALMLSSMHEADGSYLAGSGRAVSMLELAGMVSHIFSEGRSKVVARPDKDDGDTGIRLDVSNAEQAFGYKASSVLEESLMLLSKSAKGA